MISICIPTYDMAGRGAEMLLDLLSSIALQHYRNHEVIVSDDGGNEWIAELCESYRARLVRGKPDAAANLNNAIVHARGDIIKPMFQDDKFIQPDSLQKIAAAIDQGAQWVACTSHNEGTENWEHVPYRHASLARLREGENTYGSPSAMAWRRNDLRFDENLKWLFDCEFYARMAERYGVPTFVDTPIYVRQWEGMATKTVATGSQRIADSNYVVEKYR